MSAFLRRPMAASVDAGALARTALLHMRSESRVLCDASWHDTSYLLGSTSLMPIVGICQDGMGASSYGCARQLMHDPC